MKNLLRIIFLFLIICTSASEKNEISFETISFEEGISHNAAYTLMCDNKGFMWFGTMFGLIKFEGESFTKFRHDPSDKQTLTNDDIVTMTQDSDNDLWLGTYGGGLNKLDYETGNVQRFSPSFFDLENEWDGIIWDVIEDKNHNIWFAANRAGLIKLNKNTLEFTRFVRDSTDENSLASNSVTSIHIGEDEKIYVGTSEGGLHILNQKNANFKKIKSVSNDLNFKVKRINSFTKYDDQILLSTPTGVLFFDPSSEKIYKKSEFDQLNKIWINRAHLDKRENLWIGTSNGLVVMNKSTGEFSHYRTNKSESNSISGNNVVSIAEDSAGIIWLGNYMGGIDKAVVGGRKFNHYSSSEKKGSLSSNRVLDFSEDNNSKLYLATAGGVEFFDQHVGAFKNLSKAIFKSEYNKFRFSKAVEVDANNNLWVGTSNGLIKILPDRISHKLFTDKNIKIRGNRINSLHLDSKNNLWIGTALGLSKFNLNSGKSELIKHDITGKNGIAGTTILSIFEDSKGMIWVGTYAGLNLINPDENEFRLFKQAEENTNGIGNNYAFSFCETVNGELWIGTGGGLHKLNRDNYTFEIYTEKDGLPNSVICGITESNDGDLFISTNKGISKFDIDKDKFYTYNVSDGLQSNMFLEGSYLKTSGGKMLFGGINGFNIFDPDELVPNKYEPPLHITSVELFDEAVQKSSGKTAEREFQYDQNYLTFHFSALDYKNPRSILYSYKLEGLEKNWTQPSKQNFAEYKNIPPGEYRFTVKATNSDGVWSSQTTSYSFIIAAPFWATTWFYLIVLALIASAAVGIYRYKVAAALKRAKEIELIREEENDRIRKKAAADFHDELGHRLTKISLYSEILKRKLAQMSNDNFSYVEKISEISGNLSNGMRDFVWTLDPENDTLYETAIRLKDFGDELFHNSNIAFRVEGISENFQNIQLSMDWRRHLTLIFKEAMNNSLKYSDGKNVTLSFQLIDGKLFMNLRDDGVGFVISEDTKGRGLKNINRRADDLHGEVEIESVFGKGTAVKFQAALA